MPAKLKASERREIFKELVEAQDLGLNVRDSRKEITEAFDLTIEELKAIENEGIEKEWPPLNEKAADDGPGVLPMEQAAQQG